MEKPVERGSTGFLRLRWPGRGLAKSAAYGRFTVMPAKCAAGMPSMYMFMPKPGRNRWYTAERARREIGGARRTEPQALDRLVQLVRVDTAVAAARARLCGAVSAR